MELIIAIVAVVFLWFLTAGVSRLVPAVWKWWRSRPKRTKKTHHPSPVLETPKERYERRLKQLHELPLDEDERQPFAEELRERYIEELMNDVR